MFSSFSVVSGLDYVCRVDEQGDWDETIVLRWPAISGVAAKAFLGRVKRTFFVPKAAFGELGPDQPGASGSPGGSLRTRRSDIGPETQARAPARSPPRASGGACFTLLPGTGFFPVPDLIVQTRNSERATTSSMR